jgi:hypothetical protein
VSGTIAVSLDGALVPSSDGQTVLLLLNASTIETLKLNTALAVDASSTFLEIQTGAVQDMSGNAVAASASLHAITTFAGDSTAPTIASASLSLDTGVFQMLANEPILPGLTSAVATIRVTNPNANTSLVLQLENATEALGGRGVVASIPRSTLTSIKVSTTLCQPNNSQSCTIAFSLGAVVDRAQPGNPLQPATVEADFEDDVTPPNLVSVSLSLADARVSFVFDEPVDTATLQTTFHIQSSATSNTVSVQVDTSLVTSAQYSTLVAVALDDASMLSLQTETALATSTGNTFFVLGASFVEDARGNSLAPILSSSARQASVVVGDDD